MNRHVKNIHGDDDTKAKCPHCDRIYLFVEANIIIPPCDPIPSISTNN